MEPCAHRDDKKKMWRLEMHALIGIQIPETK